MKSFSLFVRALIVSCMALPLLAESGASANGNFQFALTGATGSIEFDARDHGGSARGKVVFSSTQDVSEDVDEDGASATTGVSLEVDIDCLRITGKRAVMSGIISNSSAPGLNGVRAILAVEDGGEGSKAEADRFTWGAYRSRARNWTPSDAEVPGDAGASFNWYATDAERFDDIPVLMNVHADTAAVDCKSFPTSSYAMEALPHGAGNIQVR